MLKGAVFMDIQAEFESVDIADIVCTNIKNNVPGIHRISITDRGFPTPYGSSVRTIISQGVNNVQPYVTEISQPSVPVNSYSGSAHVSIKCDPQSANAVKRRLISRGGHSVKELS